MLRKTAIANAIAFGLGFTLLGAATANAAEREDLRALRSEVRGDLRAIETDRNALYGAESRERADLRQLRRDERAGNSAGITADRAALARDRGTIHADRVALNRDRHELRHDERQLHHERHEMRHEQRVSHFNHEGTRNASWHNTGAHTAHTTRVASK